MMKLTPSDVRCVAKKLLRNGNESISITELGKELRLLGYSVHFTFAMAACIAKNSGMYVMNNHIFLIRRMHHYEIPKERKLK